MTKHEYSVEEVRAMFEAWATKSGFFITKDDQGAYESGYMMCAWSAYQSAFQSVAHLLPSGEPPSRPPIIVPPYVSADDANRLYGERFGMDWKYEAITADTFRKLHPPAQAAKVDDWRIGMFERWRAAAQEKGYAGIAEAINATPTAEPVAQGEEKN